MAQFSKQMAIIAKLKSLVRKTGKFFGGKPDIGISEEIAKKIQKSSYDLSRRREKDSYTPPYMMVAEQLQIGEDQIFRGAVYTLAAIAMNEPKNAPAIIDILEKCIKEGSHSPEQIDYVKSKTAQIRQHRNNRL